MLHGVDVSGHQPGWTPAPDDDFVFVKATEGRTSTNSQAASQLAAARGKGLQVGHYHFLWPGNAKEQAAYFVAKADIRAGDLLVCDFESTPGGHPSAADAVTFMAEVERLEPGHKVGLYCNRSDWNNSGIKDKAGDFLWIAAPGVTSSNLGAYPWTFHQYKWEPIDNNWAHPKFGSLAELKTWALGSGAPVAERIPFRGGLTCSCVVESLPWVEFDLQLRGLLTGPLRIFQLGYRTDVGASAGTHARGGCVDVDGTPTAAEIDVWRLWGWTQQPRRLTGVPAHCHGWPYKCSHLSSAARQQEADWNRKDAGLVGGAQVQGRWPVKPWNIALKERKVTVANDIADAVLTRDGKIENVWQPEGTNKFVQIANAIEELGRDDRRIKDRLAAIEKQLAAILAKLP